ncbi:MAG TPA: RidA family protein, partial [Ramlibacter sp.]|nr:RidA family protein [Ramlibacter sp.]
MKEVIDCGLPPLAQPFSWAVKGGGLLFTAHGPVRQDGSIDTGSIEAQARLTFANLRRAVQAAGGTMADVTQVLISMTDIADMKAIDAVYREFFQPPYPNRSSAAVAAL